MSPESTIGKLATGTRLLALGLLCLLTSCQSKRPNLQSRNGSFLESRPPSVSLCEARQDLEFFFKTVQKVHYNPFAYLTKEEYRSLKKHSSESLTAATQPAGGVPRRALALTVARAAAALGDGHTDVPLTAELLEPENETPCMLPFRMSWRAGHVVVGDALPELKRLQGARLVSINGRPLKEALEPMVALISGERWETRVGDLLSQQELYWASIRPVAGQTATVTVQQVGQTPEVVTLNLISLAKYQQDIPPRQGLPPLGSWMFYDEGKTCYWQYNQCLPTAQGREHIEAVFRALREKQTTNLVIDLRYNPGGSDDAVQLVIDHLTSKPYRLYSRIGARVSDHLLRANPGWYLRPLKGLKLSFARGAKPPKEVANRFAGLVYVLISPCTYSAATDLANVLHDYGLATFIGEETGGLRQSFGEAVDDRLPNSGLAFRVSCKVFYAPKPKPDDARRGTVPEIVITDELLAPFMHESDPELAFTFDFIQQRQPR